MDVYMLAAQIIDRHPFLVASFLSPRLWSLEARSRSTLNFAVISPGFSNHLPTILLYLAYQHLCFCVSAAIQSRHQPSLNLQNHAVRPSLTIGACGGCQTELDKHGFYGGMCMMIHAVGGLLCVCRTIFCSEY